MSPFNLYIIFSGHCSSNPNPYTVKPLTLVLFLSLSLSLSAQYQKGNWYYDGTTGMAFENSVGDVFFDYSTLSAYSYQLGGFLTNRLLVGSRINFLFSVPQAPNDQIQRLQFKPFARYYFPGGDRRKVSFFGELGFGTLDLLEDSGFETDFHFGGGAETSLAPGLLGTARLVYNANASGLNFTDLRFGLNVLTGQLENDGSAVSLRRGTITADANFGTISYGRMSRNGMTDYQLRVDLSPKVGLFFMDGLLAEGSISLRQFSSQTFTDNHTTGFEAQTLRLTDIGFGVDLSYYLKQDGRTFPYLTAGAGFLSTSVTSAVRTVEPPITISTSEINWRVGAGFDYFLSPNISFNGEVRYQRGQILLPQFQLATIQPQKNVRVEAGFRFYMIRN